MAEVIGRVWWEDDPTRMRIVKRRCNRCIFEPLDYNIVSPQGTAHISHEYDEGKTACGIDATGPDWWWQT